MTKVSKIKVTPESKKLLARAQAAYELIVPRDHLDQWRTINFLAQQVDNLSRWNPKLNPECEKIYKLLTKSQKAMTPRKI